MRISFFVPRCTPDNSHGRYVVELATRLGPEHNVRVYSGVIWPPLRSVAHCRRVPVPVRPALARLATLWLSSLLAPEGRAAEIVHVQGADAPFGNVVTAHSCNPAQRAAAGLGAPLWRRLNYKLGAMAEKYILSKPSTAAIIAVSQKVKNELEREYGIEGHRISVIHHGVDSVVFHPTTRERRRAEVRQRLRLAPNDFVVAFVGGDYRLKGLESLIAAARQLPRSLKILTAGVRVDARLRSLMEENDLSDRITFLGQVSDVATSLFAGADCFALPTRYDTFSLATLEAMASGLPVIVTRAAGVAELLRADHDSLILNDPADVGGLVHCLRLLLQDAALRARLGSNARRTAERHSWNEVARQTVELYSETVSI
jgi:glycosyltransferase involved in cell wall biosynthesis